jgi:L-rhamnose isomerase
MPKDRLIREAFEAARDRYAEFGVDVDGAMRSLRAIPVSLHCWQGDDVGGFEAPDASLSGGGIQTTGNYPGKARAIDELRKDIEMALSLIPGKHRLNLHASYLDHGGRPVDGNEIEPGSEHCRVLCNEGGEKAVSANADSKGTPITMPPDS